MKRGRKQSFSTVTLRPGTVLYHGTCKAEQFEVPDGPAWFSTSQRVAELFAQERDEPEWPHRRTLTYAVISPLKLIELRGISPYYPTEAELGAAFKKLGGRGVDLYDLARIVCDAGYEGWIIPRVYGDEPDIMVCDPLHHLEFQKTEPLGAARNPSRLPDSTDGESLRSEPRWTQAEAAERAKATIRAFGRKWAERLEWHYEPAYPIARLHPEMLWKEIIWEYDEDVKEDGYDPTWVEERWSKAQQDDPVIVTEWGSPDDFRTGEFTSRLEDGFHRMAVAIRLGQTTLPAFVGRSPEANPIAVTKRRMLAW